MEMFLEKQVRADAPALQHTYENFSRNLEDVVQAAHAAGAKVFLSTVATNLKDYRPSVRYIGRDYIRELLTSQLRSSREVQRLKTDGCWQIHPKSYLEAAQIDNQYAELEFRIARCYWELGDYGSAKKYFLRAQDMDTLRFRADSRIDEIIGWIAKSYFWPKSRTFRCTVGASFREPLWCHRIRTSVRTCPLKTAGQLSSGPGCV